MNTPNISRSAMLFITIVAVILLNIIVVAADEPGPKYPPRRPVERVSPTPTDPVTPPVTPTRERDRPTPAQDPPVGGTRTPPPPPPPTIRGWVWVSCLILLLLLLLLVWLLRRRKSQPSPGYPPPSQPRGGTGYTPPSPVQQSPVQQTQSQYGDHGD
ncbi:MAG TPA: hypothetical protein VJM50_21760 [Pyrinomonadaceae bacterium]|nr:hypothetical protein [Pyrinomonadaceae bacterium]